MRKNIFWGLLLICVLVISSACDNQGNTIDDSIEEVGAVRKNDQSIYLDIPNDMHFLQEDGVPYRIINNTGETQYVRLIPILEKETANGWEKIKPVDVGFCGTPDAINTEWQDLLPFSWYGSALQPGRYQLSFELISENQDVQTPFLSDVFALQNSDIDVSIKKGSLSAKGMTLLIKNRSQKEYLTGESYHIEQKIDDRWEVIEIGKKYFHLIGLMLKPKKTTKIEVNWEGYYGALPAGEYRIKKGFSYRRSPGDLGEHSLSAEFVID